MKVILESNYFPPLSYMHLLLNAKEYFITNDEPYVKQTYRNRANILTSQGIISLTVPVEKKGQRKVSTCKISYAENWQQKHLRTIESAYGKSPFFEHYFPYIEQLFSQKIEFLTELNEEALSLCFKFLNAQKEVNQVQNQTNDFLNVTNSISPKKESSISNQIDYHQMFGNKFAQDLSILDVLFCEGPLAYSIVKTQIKTKYQV
jgi:hypothetical protein